MYIALNVDYQSHIQTEVDWELIKKLEQIGLDEISLKKGHKDFVTIVSAYLGSCAIDWSVGKSPKRHRKRLVSKQFQKI